MITFQEFLYKSSIILERYYPPDEPLPGSKQTPMKKAENKIKKLSRKRKNPEKVKAQKDKLSAAYERNVKHGAGNPTVNPHSDPDVSVYQTDDKTGTHIEHPKSGIYFTIRKEKDIKGKPHHAISWYTKHDTDELSPKEKIKIANKAKNIYYKNIQHRLPSHSVVSATPATKRHEGVYKHHGLGDADEQGTQYANVGRQLSPREQQNRRRPSRLSPLNMR